MESVADNQANAAGVAAGGDEKEYWGVIEGKIYCAAATDSGDVGTDGTNLVWHVRVIGDVLENGC